MNNISTRSLVIIVGSVIAALFIFQAGMFIGYNKALHSYRGENRYFMAMSGGKGTVMRFADDFSPNHGAVGKVISVSLPDFIIADTNEREKTVVIGRDTIIRRFGESATSTDIKEGDFTVILGEPDADGKITAKFVRIAPPPPQNFGDGSGRNVMFTKVIEE